jgi:hypothetical protein
MQLRRIEEVDNALISVLHSIDHLGFEYYIRNNNWTANKASDKEKHINVAQIK